MTIFHCRSKHLGLNDLFDPEGLRFSDDFIIGKLESGSSFDLKKRLSFWFGHMTMKNFMSTSDSISRATVEDCFAIFIEHGGDHSGDLRI